MQDIQEEPEEKAEAAVIQKNRYNDTALPMPSADAIPDEYADRIQDLFDTWHAVKARNANLTSYYEMEVMTDDLGVSIPPQLTNINTVTGWAKKAVDVRAVRSNFDGFVFEGRNDKDLDDLVKQNGLKGKYSMACRSMLIHGLSTMTVMRGTKRQPAAKVRTFSANQSCVLWDKDEEDIACGIVLAAVDKNGHATKYVCHFPDAVITFESVGGDWTTDIDPNPLGVPLMVALRHDPDIDKPLGHSIITPELKGIVDKAMRDVLRMEVGAEFFTAPQRYILGAAEDLFSGDDEEGESGDGDGPRKPDTDAAKFKAYIGAYLALTRDESGEIPTVGQFPAGDADNFIKVFENDAQRFSGASNVPIGQLGVLSNNYTSSDALGAANDPLILDVQTINRNNERAMERVGELMMAISRGKKLEDLDEHERSITVSFTDPAQPTLSARADAWTKLAAVDPSLVGTRVWYEGMGFSQATIDRIMAEGDRKTVIGELAKIAESAGIGATDGQEPSEPVEPEESLFGD